MTILGPVIQPILAFALAVVGTATTDVAGELQNVVSKVNGVLGGVLDPVGDVLKAVL